MRRILLWIVLAIVYSTVILSAQAEIPEGLTRGLFAGQSITLTLGQNDIAPYLKAKGFAAGDTIKLTHKGHGRFNVERLTPSPSLRLTIATTDYLSARQVAERLTALGLQAEDAVMGLGNGDNLTAIVTSAGAESSNLLGRRGFHTDDRVTVSKVKERLAIKRVSPTPSIEVTFPLIGYLPATNLQELGNALGIDTPTPTPGIDSIAASSETPDPGQIQAEIAQAQTEFEADILEANEGQVLTAVGFQQLKALLPERLPNLVRVHASGERMQMMGADLASAQGQYEKSGDTETNIKIEIMDLGNLSGFMRRAMVSWLGQSFDNATDHGYVKTVEYRGYKGIEEWNAEAQLSMLQLYVGERFLVSVEGRKVTMDAIHNAADQIDLAKLESLPSATSAAVSSSDTAGTATSVETGVSDVDAALEQMSQTGTSQPVDPDALKSCLPRSAAGFQATETSSTRNSMMGVPTTAIRTDYQNGAGNKISVSVMDTAAMPPELRMGMAPWNIMQFDTETDTGYQKTIQIGKHRALEVVDRSAPETSIALFVASRFVLSVQSENASIGQVRQVLGQIDLTKLEGLAAR